VLGPCPPPCLRPWPRRDRDVAGRGSHEPGGDPPAKRNGYRTRALSSRPGVAPRVALRAALVNETRRAPTERLENLWPRAGAAAVRAAVAVRSRGERRRDREHISAPRPRSTPDYRWPVARRHRSRRVASAACHRCARVASPGPRIFSCGGLGNLACRDNRPSRSPDNLIRLLSMYEPDWLDVKLLACQRFG